MTNNNINILIGSTKRQLDRRIILGGNVSTEMIALFNVILKQLDYCIVQVNAGNLEYSAKIQTLENLLVKLKYACPDICNYWKELSVSSIVDGGDNTTIDFKTSNATIKIDTIDYEISELQITI
jgi:hypothetical protein